jgi:hypothetical protein
VAVDDEKTSWHDGTIDSESRSRRPIPFWKRITAALPEMMPQRLI